MTTNARVRGAVTVEYTVLIGAVALVCLVALVVLGIAVVDDFELLRRLVLFPIP